MLPRYRRDTAVTARRHHPLPPPPPPPAATTAAAVDCCQLFHTDCCFCSPLWGYGLPGLNTTEVYVSSYLDRLLQGAVSTHACAADDAQPPTVDARRAPDVLCSAMAYEFFNCITSLQSIRTRTAGRQSSIFTSRGMTQESNKPLAVRRAVEPRPPSELHRACQTLLPPPPLPAPSLSLLLLLTLLLADKTAASYNGSYTCAHYCSNVATGLL